MSENNKAAIPSPTQNPRNSFPAWRLPNGTINASDAELEIASSSCGTWEWGCAAVVVGAIIAEFIIAYIHPAYDSVLNRLGTVAADAAIAIGIVGEVIFGRLDAGIQTELRSRSNKQLAEAIERAANAERDTEKLRAITAWRRLNQKEHKSLALALRASGQGESVRFSVVMNDQESLYFAQQISIPFKAAGWKVGYRFESYTHGIMTGILLPEPRDNWLEEMKTVNGRVRDAFMTAEISFVNGWPLEPYMYTDDNAPLSVPMAWVYVGPKPMPLLG